MIGTIRKHSAWLWWLVAGLTIISFVIFMGQGGARNGGHAGSGGYGVLYGKPVTPEQLAQAQNEFRIVYWMQNHEFPENNPNLTRAERDRDIYQRLILSAKIKEMGIQVGTDAQATVANNFLHSLARDGEVPPLELFVEKVLAPAGLTAADFQQVMTDEVAIGQLEAALGLSGALVAPQEVSQRYDRENQEVSAQAVFFSTTNYIAEAAATPAAVSRFYTNYMAHYRLPDQVALNYVSYELSNYQAAAEEKIGPTNLTAQVEANFKKYGVDKIPGAKTPAEARAKIRSELLRQAEGGLALEQARAFATKLCAMDPVVATNLPALAASSGLALHTTAPFDEQEGPAEFNASADLVKTAFSLNAGSPYYYKPLASADAIYVIGLARQLPSYIPPFSLIHRRVAEDYQFYEASRQALAAATNFYYQAVVQLATGKTFAQAAVKAGVTPVILPPFSLSSQSVPELEEHGELNQFKQAAFGTTPGHMSQVQATADGAFVLYVQSLLPIDETAKQAKLPEYVNQLRHSRENEAFNRWLLIEENRELPNTPVAAELQNEKASPRR